MACHRPITTWVDGVHRESGKKKLSFKKPADPWNYQTQVVPCGKCLGCRLSKSRDWATRCVHEASLYEDNCFLTLTFNEENAPHDFSIRKEHLQKFFKRLRKRYNGKLLRYFACGEYGALRNRPHYHVILFNHRFEDQEKVSQSVTGDWLYTSKTLEELWSDPQTKQPYGFVTIGNVTFESAAYVARYQFKKQSCKKHYQLVDTETGEAHELEKEFVLMSRGRNGQGGIGKKWWEKYKHDTKKDHLTVAKKIVPIPKYYDKLHEREDLAALEKIKEKRRQILEKNAVEYTPKRLAAKEKVKEVQLKQLMRALEK